MVNKKYAVMWRKTLSAFVMFSMTMTSVGMLSMNVATVKAAEADASKTDSERFDEFTKQIFQDSISSDVLSNNLNVIDNSKYGIDQSKLSKVVSSGYDEESLKAQVEASKTIHKFLESIQYDHLTDEQKDLYDLMKFEVNTPEDEEKFMYYKKAFGAYSGIQTNLITTLTAYNFDERQDFVDYLELIKSVPTCLDEAVKFEQKRSELGLFMSDRELDEVIESIKALIADPENQILITTFNHTVDKFGLNNRDTIRFKKQNRETVLNEIIPAYEAAIKGLEALRGTGIGSEDGLCALPLGREYYVNRLHYYSGTDRSPLEYIEIFDQLSEQCMKELNQIAQTATLQNFTYPSAKYTNGKPEDYLNELMENTVNDFTPLENIKFNIKYVDEALGQFAAPAYVMTPQVDAKTEFNVNINPAYAGSASYDTVAHEAYPGHLYQFVTMNNSDKNPAFHVYTNYGYIEGWANHVQSMAYYYTDASPLFARYMQLVMNYSTYQIYKLDILVNYLGYTKEMAMDYLKELQYTGDPEMVYYHFLTVPAYNMCYAAGQAELELMVNEAQETLGQNFSYQAFHDFYLKYTCCTFETINHHFDQWLTEQTKAAK